MAKDVKKIMESVTFKKIETKQQQGVLDLETMQDAKITVLQVKFVAPDYDAAKFGTPDEYQQALFAAASELVSPIQNRTAALLKFAQSELYTASKVEALKGGNYLTQDLSRAIVDIMRANVAFADLTAKEAIDKWKEGYKNGKPAAAKYLKLAQEQLEMAQSEDADL